LEVREKLNEIGYGTHLPIVQRVRRLNTWKTKWKILISRLTSISMMIFNSSSLSYPKSYILLLFISYFTGNADVQIDFDSSASDDRICVRAGIDEELDQWRSDYAGKLVYTGDTWPADTISSRQRFGRTVLAIRPDKQLQITMAVLRPTVVKYNMGHDVNAVYFPQLGHLAVLTNRNMLVEFPAHLEWELRVG
jgi:hypothetical protein